MPWFAIALRSPAHGANMANHLRDTEHAEERRLPWGVGYGAHPSGGA